METHEQTFEIKKRRRPWLRWLKRAGWGLLALLIVAVCAWSWWHYSIQKRLDEALAELDRSEPGWRLADIEAAREQVPEEKNGARVVVTAARLLPKDWPSQAFADRFCDLEPETQLAPEDFAALTKELSHLGPALKEARKLAGLPRGRHHITYRMPVIGTLLNDQQKSRLVTALLHYDALRHIQNSDVRQSVQTCRAAFNAGRSLGDEPLSISQLIRNACIFIACRDLERILAQNEPSPEELDAMKNMLHDEEVFPDYLLVARSERAVVHETLLEIENGQHDTDPRTSTWRDNVRDWFEREQIRAGHPNVLAFLNRFVAIAQLPESERMPAERQFLAEILELDRRRALPALMLSSLEMVNDACRRKHACLRCLIVALAAERYRRANQNWPDSLDKLCPQFLADVPHDPFDNEPLRYHRVEDGIVIYSVSSDGVDNNGNLDRENPKEPGVDIGCRLWDVAKRRQPARLKPPEAVKPE